MAQLPVNRTTSNTPADHIADHNEIHRLHDILDGSAGPSQALATLDTRYPLAVTTATQGTPKTVLRIDSTDVSSTKGPFVFEVDDVLFNSTNDVVLRQGYNSNAGGSQFQGLAPSAAWTIETDYEDSPGHHTLEWYQEFKLASTRTRTVTDAVTTSASPTVTSATLNCVLKPNGGTAPDIGAAVTGAGIPTNSYVGIVNSATSIGLSSSPSSNIPVNATATASGVTLTLTGGQSSAQRAIFQQYDLRTSSIHFELRYDNLYFLDRGSAAQMGTMTVTQFDWGTNTAVLGAGQGHTYLNLRAPTGLRPYLSFYVNNADVFDLRGGSDGMQMGTGTAQKLGFWGTTPRVQPSATPIAATDLASVITLANFLRTSLSSAAGGVGLVA